VIESSAVAILATGGQAPAWKERPPTTSGVPTASRRHTGGGASPRPHMSNGPSGPLLKKRLVRPGTWQSSEAEHSTGPPPNIATPVIVVS
jgi:hypothetical protein